MRAAFTITADHEVSLYEMGCFLRAKTYPIQGGLLSIGGLPTGGVIQAQRRGLWAYIDEEKQIVTIIFYKWGVLTVTVIGGDEQIKKEWKKFLRSFHLGPKPKRGRPKKLATSDK